MKYYISLLKSILTIVVFTLISNHTIQAQCRGNTQFPPTQEAPINCELDTISTVSWSGDYTTVRNLAEGAIYQFALDEAGFITIRDAADTSMVLASGNGPFQYTATSSDSISVNWFTGSNCTFIPDVSRISTVQQICSTPPCQNPNKLFNQAFSAPVCFQNLMANSVSPGYYVMDSLDSEVTYVFGMSIPGNITIRDAANPSDVIAQGAAPLSYSNSNLDSIEIHFNTGDQCSLGGVFNASFYGGCPPPCQNRTLFPATPIVAPDTSGTRIIATNQYAGDYAIVTNIKAGFQYKFASERNSDMTPDYITVRDASDSTKVIRSNISPLLITAESNNDLQVHFNLNDNLCGIQSTNRTTTVECLTCAPYICDLSVPVLAIPTDGTCSATVTASNNGIAPISIDQMDVCNFFKNLFPAAPPTEIRALWYKFEVPSSGNIRMDISNKTGNWIHTSATIYTGKCDSLYREICGKSFTPGVSGDNNFIEFRCLPIGDSVYLKIWNTADFSTSVGSIDFCIQEIDDDPIASNVTCYCAADITLSNCLNGEIHYESFIINRHIAYYKYTHNSAIAATINVSLDMLLGPDCPFNGAIEVMDNCFATDSVASGDDQVTFLAAPNESYIISIGLRGFIEGNFLPVIGSYEICLDQCTPPDNSICDVSVPELQLGCSNPTAGTLNCASAVYYRFTPAVDSSYTFRINNVFRPIAVFGDCEEEEPMESGIGSITVCLEGGQTYYVGIGSDDLNPFTNANEDFTICVTTALNTGSDIPNNEDCSSATRLEFATDPCIYNVIQQGYGCNDGVSQEEVWYRVKYPENSDKFLGIQINEVLGSSADWNVELYRGSCPGLQLDQTGSADDENSLVIFEDDGLTRGADVYVKVYRTDGEPFSTILITSLEVSKNIVCDLGSTVCDNATTITASSTTTCESPMVGRQMNLLSSSNNYVWYNYTPAEDDTLVIEVSNITTPCFDIQLNYKANIHIPNAFIIDEIDDTKTVAVMASTTYLLGVNVESLENNFNAYQNHLSQKEFFQDIVAAEYLNLAFGGQELNFDVCIYQAPGQTEVECLSNVECELATAMTDGACESGVLDEDCDSDRTAWYTYALTGTATELYTLAVSEIPEGLKPRITVYEVGFAENCGNLNVNSSYIYREFTEAVTIPLTGSNRYYFSVELFQDYDFSGNPKREGSFNFCLNKCTEANLPTNYSCENPVEITTTNCVEGKGNICGGGIELWYRFIPEVTSDYNITVTNQVEGLIPDIHFYSINQFSTVDCQLDFDYRECYNLNQSLTADEEYYISVRFEAGDHTQLEASDFTLCVEELNCSNISNSNCSNPIALDVGNSGTCFEQKCNLSESWFVFTSDFLSAPENYTITTTEYVGIISTIELYGECSFGNGSNEFESVSNFPLTYELMPAETYFVRIRYNVPGSSHPPIPNRVDFEICILPCGDDAVENGTCAEAISLEVGESIEEACINPYEDYYGCPDNSGIASNCGNGPGGDLWYEAIVPASGSIALFMDVSENLKAAMYQGECSASLRQVGFCSVDINGQIIGMTGLTPGSTVYIQVWNAYTTDYQSNDDREFSMCLWDPFPSDCPEDLVLMGIVNSSSLFEASSTITSDQQISAMTVYSAPDGTVLEEEFQVDDNTEFEVNRVGCGTASGSFRTIPTDITHLVARQLGYEIDDPQR